MKFDFNINLNITVRDSRKDRTDEILRAISQSRTEEMAKWQDVLDEVTQDENAESAATTAINGLIAEVQDLKNQIGQGSQGPTSADLDGLLSRLQAARQPLAAAVAANTGSGSTGGDTGGSTGGNATIAISPTSITGNVGEAVSGAFSATGGDGNYTFSADDQLPADFSLNSGGTYSASPAAAETATTMITATDGTGATGTASVSISITDPNAPA